MTTADLPALNAILNGIAAVLLVLGFRAIKRKQVERHRAIMIGALFASGAFLISYLVYHALHGSTRFGGPPAVRVVYLGILLVHTVLAAANLPLVIITVARALRGDFQRHRKIAWWTWRVWMIVSVTGVVIYLMLYQIWPPVRATAGGDAFTRARALHQKGEDRAALDAYREAQREGHLGATCFAAVLSDRLDGTDTASAAIEHALAKNDREPSCLVLRGRSLVLADKATAALPVLERAVQLAPDDAFSHATLGFAQFRLHQYEAAARSFERSIELEPHLAANVYNAGYAHFLYGNYAAARPLLVKAVAMKDLDPELAERAKEDLQVIDGTLWICPMHPEERGKEGDSCSKCGMPLEPAARGLPR